MAAKEVAFGQHVRHALNRRQIEVAITIDHANFGAHDLEICHHCVEWTAQIPCGVHQRGSVDNRRAEAPSARSLSINSA